MYVLVSRVTDPQNFQLIGPQRAPREKAEKAPRETPRETPPRRGLPPADMLDEVAAAWREAGFNVEECLQRCATVTREFVYTPGGHGDLRRSFTPKFNRQHSVSVKHKTLAEILNPQPRAASVFHRLLDWIDRVDIASQTGAPKPDFETDEGEPIFPEDDDPWWLTDVSRRVAQEEKVEGGKG